MSDRPSLQSLILGLWTASMHPHRMMVPKLRERLYEAALDEIRRLASQGKNYDPGADNRFKWACQWLEVAEGERPSVDCHLATIVEYLLTPARIPCGKERAAGEALTLALG